MNYTETIFKKNCRCIICDSRINKHNMQMVPVGVV